LAIEHFNRPVDRGRVEAVLIFLDHSFEMLLKASILEKGGRIREPRSKQTFGYDKCVRVGLNDKDIGFLDEDQALTLQTTNGLRDAAQHHIVDVSEGHLYVVAQSSVTLFRDLLKTVFGSSLYDFFPERVLPVCTRPPADLASLFDEEISEIKKLLEPGSRRSIDAAAKLRGLAIFDGAVSGQNHQPSPADLKRFADSLKLGKSWQEIFPGVAALNMTTEANGVNINLRISKKEGVPVRLISEADGMTGAVAIRRVNESDYYNLGLQALSKKVGIGRNKLLEVIREIGIQDDLDYFKLIRVGKVEGKMYSQQAIRKLKEAVQTLDVEEIWSRRKNRKGKK